MTDALTVGFVPFSAPAKTVLAVFCDGELQLGPATRKALGPAADLVKRAAAVSAFKGKNGSTIDLLEPEGIKIQRLIVIGTGKPSDLKEKDFLKLGGVLAGKLNAASTEVTVMAEHAGGAFKPGQAAAVAAGIRLRAYKFDRYKTKKKDESAALRAEVSVAVNDVAKSNRAFAPSAHVADGVEMARDLVNEPPNVLFPEEFARRASGLRKLGVEVEVLDVKAMTRLGMGALLGVGQGSARPRRSWVL